MYVCMYSYCYDVSGLLSLSARLWPVGRGDYEFSEAQVKLGCTSELCEFVP